MNRETYQADFDMSLDDLKGRVLDLGAGTRQFAFECAEMGMERVWSLAERRDDWYPVLAMLSRAKLMKKNSLVLERWREVNRRSVAALMQKLPFADNSFEVVVSHNALANVFVSGDEMARAFGEAVRVGRRVYVFPIWLENWTEEEKARVREIVAVFKADERLEIREEKTIVEVMGLKVTASRLVLTKKGS